MLAGSIDSAGKRVMQDASCVEVDLALELRKEPVGHTLPVAQVVHSAKICSPVEIQTRSRPVCSPGNRIKRAGESHSGWRRKNAFRPTASQPSSMHTLFPGRRSGAKGSRGGNPVRWSGRESTLPLIPDRGIDTRRGGLDWGEVAGSGSSASKVVRVVRRD